MCIARLCVMPINWGLISSTMNDSFFVFTMLHAFKNNSNVGCVSMFSLGTAIIVSIVLFDKKKKL